MEGGIERARVEKKSGTYVCVCVLSFCVYCVFVDEGVCESLRHKP